MLQKSHYERNFLLEHIKTNKLYTLKELKKDSLLDTDKITAARIEVEAAKCDHPFLANPEFVYQSSNALYLIFEFMRGGDMQQLIDKYRRLPERQAQFYTAQIILALIHLHKMKIVLRDLRPENIHLNSKGYITLNSFGKHTFLDDEKKMNQIKTTEANSVALQKYLAPEVITGESISGAMDWWALGIVVYEMLVGIPPFFSQTPGMLKQYISSREIKYPDPLKYHILVTDNAKDFIFRVFL